MNTHSALERAIIAEIRYLSGELERIRQEAPASAAPASSTPASSPAAPNPMATADYMAPALADPGFRNWLLRQRLEVR